jgi:hypothetical protein
MQDDLIKIFIFITFRLLDSIVFIVNEFIIGVFYDGNL